MYHLQPTRGGPSVNYNNINLMLMLMLILIILILILILKILRRGRPFHAAGPAREKPRPPNPAPHLGLAQTAVPEDPRPGRLLECATVWTLSDRYCGARSVCTRCIIRHSLQVIPQSIGNQCNCRSAEVTWPRGCRLRTSRAAAFRTRCSGSVVHRGRQARQSYSSPAGKVWTRKPTELRPPDRRDV